MAGFKQCRVSDGHLADVLILSAQEPVQLAALHKSIQSTGYFGGGAPPPSKSSPRLASPPSPCRDNASTFRKSKPLSGRPQSARGKGRGGEIKFQLCSVAEVCKSINTRDEPRLHTHTHTPLLESTCNGSLIGPQ